MENPIRRLPDAELEVMQALWSCTIPATSREIEAALPAGRTMAQTTVLTLLSRLADRGMVTVEKAGRRSLYTPAVSREQYTAAQSRTLFRKLAAYRPLPRPSATAVSPGRSCKPSGICWSVTRYEQLNAPSPPDGAAGRRAVESLLD